MILLIRTALISGDARERGLMIPRHQIHRLEFRFRLEVFFYVPFFFCRFAYSYLKHNGFIEFDGMKGCYFCYYPIAAQTVTTSGAAISGMSVDLLHLNLQPTTSLHPL